MKIEIEWTHDHTDCETCGSSYSEGATVKIDGVVELEFTPIAACYDGNSFQPDFVYAQILQHLGHELVTTQQEYVPSPTYDEDEE